MVIFSLYEDGVSLIYLKMNEMPQLIILAPEPKKVERHLSDIEQINY
jgi:hypothetical protein